MDKASEWLSTEAKVFPRAVREGGFGSNVKAFLGFKANERKGTADEFNTIVIFGDVTLETTSGERVVEPVVIKKSR